MEVAPYDVGTEVTELVSKALCGESVALYTKDKFYSLKVVDTIITARWGGRGISSDNITEKVTHCETKRELGDKLRMMIEKHVTIGYKEK